MIMVAGGLERLAAGPPTTEEAGLIAPARTALESCSLPLVARVNQAHKTRRGEIKLENPKVHQEVDTKYNFNVIKDYRSDTRPSRSKVAQKLVATRARLYFYEWSI